VSALVHRSRERRTPSPGRDTQGRSPHRPRRSVSRPRKSKMFNEVHVEPESAAAQRSTTANKLWSSCARAGRQCENLRSPDGTSCHGNRERVAIQDSAFARIRSPARRVVDQVATRGVRHIAIDARSQSGPGGGVPWRKEAEVYEAGHRDITTEIDDAEKRETQWLGIQCGGARRCAG